MLVSKFYDKVADKTVDKKEIADWVIENPKLLPELLNGLNSEKARIRYGCAKILILISERKPGLIYPEFTFFTHMLDHEKQILQWNAVTIIANLTTVDTENKNTRNSTRKSAEKFLKKHQIEYR